MINKKLNKIFGELSPNDKEKINHEKIGNNSISA